MAAADLIREPDAAPAPTPEGPATPPSPAASGGIPYLLQRPAAAEGAAPFPSLASAVMERTADINRLREERAQSAARQQDQLRAQGEAMRPLYGAAEAALAAPRPEAPAAPRLAAPPSGRLNEFLAPVEGESPVNTITKLIHGVGLMAAGFSGLAQGEAKGVLASLTGALRGWQEGDRERADRAFADWKAKSDTMLKDWEMRRQTYQDLMTKANLNVADALKAVELKAKQFGDDRMAEAARLGELDTVLGHVEKDRAFFGTMLQFTSTLDQQYQLKMLELGLTERMAAMKQEASQQADAAEVDRLRDDFLKASLPFTVLRDSYQRVQAAAKTPSAAGDLALIFNYMKILDPGSVVREGEFATAQNAAGVPEQVRALWNRALSGQRLTDTVRTDFVDTAGRLYTQALTTHEERETQFRDLATKRQIDPGRIVIDLAGRNRAERPRAATAPGGTQGWTIERVP